MNITEPIGYSYRITDNLYTGEYSDHWSKKRIRMKKEEFCRVGLIDSFDLRNISGQICDLDLIPDSFYFY